MKIPELFSNTRFRFIFLVIFLLAAMFAKLGDAELRPIGSALYASISREMLVRGDFLTPHVPYCANWTDFYDHPPLMFWLAATSFKIFGTSDFAAKLPSEMFAIAAVLLTYYLGYIIGGSWTAFFAGIIMVTTPLFNQQSRVFELETVLIFFVLLAIVSFILGLRKNRKYFLLFGISTGLAFLGKGFPAYATYATVVLYIIIAKNWKLLKYKELWFGFLLGIIIPFFWIIPQIIFEGDKFFELYVKKQIIGSVAGRGDVLSLGKKILNYFYFFPALFSYYLPWGPVGIFVIYKILKKKLVTDEILILLLLTGIIFVSFSIPGYKDNYYLLPMWPAWAVIIGYRSETWFHTERLKRRVTSILLTLFIIFCFFWIFFPSMWGIKRNPEFPLMANKVKELVPKKEIVFIYRFFYLDMIGMFPWYFDHGVSNNIDSEQKLQKMLLSAPKHKKYCFLRRTDYDTFNEYFRNKTSAIYELGRYIIITNKQHP
jgi:4-amino-4-deoxy-L-arabinose transferase-like glycosyltransferase